MTFVFPVRTSGTHGASGAPRARWAERRQGKRRLARGPRCSRAQRRHRVPGHARELPSVGLAFEKDHERVCCLYTCLSHPSPVSQPLSSGSEQPSLWHCGRHLLHCSQSSLTKAVKENVTLLDYSSVPGFKNLFANLR